VQPFLHAAKKLSTRGLDGLLADHAVLGGRVLRGGSGHWRLAALPGADGKAKRLWQEGRELPGRRFLLH